MDSMQITLSRWPLLQTGPTFTLNLIRSLAGQDTGRVDTLKTHDKEEDEQEAPTLAD